MHGVPRRTSISIGFLTAAGLALSGLGVIPAAVAASQASISISDPGHPVAGTVVLSGTVAKATNAVTSVLYVVDVTASSKRSATGSDCGDINADAAVGGGEAGDVLDCELAAVKALNSSLLASSNDAGVQVGLEAFGSIAALADVNAAGATFAPPGDTGGEAQPRIITAVTSVQHHRILRYNLKTLGTTGITFSEVIQTANAAFATAPAGPKWLFLLSDGNTPVNTDPTSTAKTLTDLHNSGIHLSSFAVGDDSNCHANGALAKLAAATGEACTKATTPGSLATQLTGSQPDGISDVTVSIGSTTVTADVNAIGGWTAKFTLGKGSYKATANAHFTSGGTASSDRAFSVKAAPGSGGPKAGTVRKGPGSLLATAIHVNRPRPSRAAAPSTVTGRVGLASGRSMMATKRLNGATVLLQGRKYAGGTWVTLDRDKVKAGKYQLRWKPRAGVGLLRVSMAAQHGLAGTSTGVPRAYISACAVQRHGSSWSMTCRTTAKPGSKVLLYKGKHVVDRAKATSGLVKVHGSGQLGGHVLVVKLSPKRHAHQARLAL